MESVERITVVFQAAGYDLRIANLDKLTQSKLYNRKHEFEKVFVIELELTADALDEDTAISIAVEWLTKHRLLLDELDGRLKLEIQTVIGPRSGSKGLSLPHEFLGLLADLGCDFLHQYCRMIGSAELD